MDVGAGSDIPGGNGHAGDAVSRGICGILGAVVQGVHKCVHFIDAGRDAVDGVGATSGELGFRDGRAQAGVAVAEVVQPNVGPAGMRAAVTDVAGDGVARGRIDEGDLVSSGGNRVARTVVQGDVERDVAGLGRRSGDGQCAAAGGDREAVADGHRHGGADNAGGSADGHAEYVTGVAAAGGVDLRAGIRGDSRRVVGAGGQRIGTGCERQRLLRIAGDGVLNWAEGLACAYIQHRDVERSRAVCRARTAD